MSSSPQYPHDLQRDLQRDLQDESIERLLSDHFERAHIHQSDRSSINAQTSISEFDEMWRAARVGSSRPSSPGETRQEKRRAPSSPRGLRLSFAALCLAALIGVVSASLLKSTHLDTQSPMYSLSVTPNAHLSNLPPERLPQERVLQERSYQESSLQNSFTWGDGWLEGDEWSIDEPAYSSL